MIECVIDIQKQNQKLDLLLTGGVVIGQLLEWIRWHFTDGERLAAEILSTENPEQHREYWDCVSLNSLKPGVLFMGHQQTV